MECFEEVAGRGSGEAERDAYENIVPQGPASGWSRSANVRKESF